MAVVRFCLSEGMAKKAFCCSRSGGPCRRAAAALTSAAALLLVVAYCRTLNPTWPKCGSAFSLLPASRSQLLRGFARRTTDVERAKLVAAVRVLSEALRPAGVTFFLYAGSLLGSYRHHGLVPWDDDVDILANYSQIEQLTTALSSMAGYRLYTGYPLRYKFYPSDGNLISGKAWTWPYVDICFFNESATHVFDIVPGLTAYANYPKEYVFPLVHRPYEGLMLPAPRHSRRVILIDIGNLGLCATNKWSHRTEADTPKYLQCCAPCEMLFDVYPFVSRDESGPETVEQLRLGNENLSTYVTENCNFEKKWSAILDLHGH